MCAYRKSLDAPEVDLRAIFPVKKHRGRVGEGQALYSLCNVYHAKVIDCRHLTSVLSNCSRTGSRFMRPENDLPAIFIVKLQ